LGITVAELEATMSAREFMLWDRLYRQENIEKVRATAGASSPESFDAELSKMQRGA